MKKWSLKNPLVLILIFFIVSTIIAMWNSPFYKTPADKALNVIKGIVVGVTFLGALYFYSEKRGRILRGEGSFDEDRKYDWLIIVLYLVWFYMWEYFDVFSESNNPGFHYMGMLMGFLAISFVWFERDLLSDFLWKIMK